ncbi:MULTISPECIES: glycosyl hydrolase [Sphingopyxis]|uniref:glycosyl hydrolase n=1 Tax=Sphingopyxis TaxID=165697 RepID=UPI001D0A8AA2|nr:MULTISPECIES: glycosyl hydrolase [Sphingopyxis]
MTSGQPRHRWSKAVGRGRLAAIFFACLPLGSGSAWSAETGPVPSINALEEEFKTPPPDARPRVWWHWMGGNVTESGISRDLEWMSRIGLGGAQIFNVELQTPQIVPPTRFGEARWGDMIRHAVATAQEYGLELAVAASPGWSETGGPWVTPAQAMKKLVWSEVEVEGGRTLSIELPSLPDVAGPFQNMDAERGAFVHRDAAPAPRYARDVRVIAFPAPPDAAIIAPSCVRTSEGIVSAPLLWDGDHSAAMIVDTQADRSASLVYCFDAPVTARSATLSIRLPADYPGAPPPPSPELQVSDDGKDYRSIGRFDLVAPQNSITFDQASGRYFRLQWPDLRGVVDARGRPMATRIPVVEFSLSASPRIHRFEEKAGFAVGVDLVDAPTPAVAMRDVVALSSVVDISDKLTAGGRIEWHAPPGRWIIQRFGWSLTGSMNGPAPAAATGLEVDKLDPRHVRSYLDQYAGHFPVPMGGKGIGALMLDSYEAGAQNWTDNMLAEFVRRNGYPLENWLPALTGRIVASASQSDRVLWDFRRTLGALMSEAHYGAIAAYARENGIKLYSEAHESHRAFIGDGIDAKRHADVPMSAIWVERPAAPFKADIRESASVAHVYGQALVAAESFTAAGNAYGFDPASLKATADIALASGLNQFVIHTSVHQPAEEKPGLGLGPFGQWFTRHETWADNAKPWIDYLARSSHLLQQGVFQADIAYFYGEDSNVTTKFGKRLPDIPAGYAYDFVNAHGLNNALRMADGKLVSDGGTAYRLLVIDPDVQWMSLETLRRIATLVEQGLVLVGDRPNGTPSAADDSEEFQRLADRLWPADRRASHASTRNIFCGRCLEQALGELALGPDVLAVSGEVDFVHRKLRDGDIYFVRETRGEDAGHAISFRRSGMVPEVWDAVSGRIYRAEFRDDGKITTVSLPLGPSESAFVLFRPFPGDRQRPRLPSGELRNVVSIDGEWTLRWGDREIRLDQGLFDWTASEDIDLRHYSGKATYNISFTLPDDWPGKGGRAVIDLGKLGNLARVRLNGEDLGGAWNPPYRIDTSGALRKGENVLEVDITNLWRNRMIADAGVDSDRRRTWASHAPFAADMPLQSSGLLGPVRLGLEE